MPCVRWQGKLIDAENTVYENTYTDFSVSKNDDLKEKTLAKNQVVTDKSIKQEKVDTKKDDILANDTIEEEPINTQPNKIKEDKIEKDKIIKTNIEKGKTEKTDTKTNYVFDDLTDSRSNFKQCESLINELYEKVFSKSPNFKPTKNETIGDLLIYLGYRAKSVGVYENFKNVYKISLIDDNFRSNENYVPNAIKLCVYVDKKQDKGYTKKVVGYLLKAILYLFDDINDDNVISLTVNSMGAVYTYLINNNIDVN